MDENNLYIYCSNNPLYWTDPLGLSKQKSKDTQQKERTGTKPYWPQKFESKVPRYGNYGGPGYGDPTYKIKPIDEMDGYFREHDIGWAAGKGDAADIILYQKLRNLPRDPRKWNPPAPNPQEADLYRKGTQFWFGLRYDYLTAKEKAWEIYSESPGL